MTLEKVVNVSLKIHDKWCVNYCDLLRLGNRGTAEECCQHFLETFKIYWQHIRKNRENDDL